MNGKKKRFTYHINYVDDIIFVVTDESVCENFANLTKLIRNEHDMRTYISQPSNQENMWRHIYQPIQVAIIYSSNCGTDSAKPYATLMSSSTKIDKDDYCISLTKTNLPNNLGPHRVLS